MKSLFKIDDLSSTEKKTFSLHMGYSLIEGILAGLIVLNEFVFVKSLMGSGYQASMLFQFATVVFILLIFFNVFLKRVRNKKRLLKRTALLTRIPLLLLFFFPRSPEPLTGNSIYHLVFLGIFLIYYLANPIIFPTINLFLKNTYTHGHFGRLYSYSTTFKNIVMMLTTFAYGWMLDINGFIFVYVFPFAAVLGIVSVFMLAAIPYTEPVKEANMKADLQAATVAGRVKKDYKSIPFQPNRASTTSAEHDKTGKMAGIWSGIRQSVNEMRSILKNNIPYRHFQTGFMFYGFGFMGSYTVIILFFEYGLGLNYSSVAFYRNAYNLLSILMLPFFGKLIGQIDPRRFASISFMSMFVFLLSLMLTQFIDGYFTFWDIKVYYMMIGYILFHGVFAATMALLWSIGSAYFCTPSEAGTYQSIHLGMTALRSLFAPLLGVLFYELWGFSISFAIAMLSLTIGSVIMLVSQKTHPLTKKEYL